MAVGHFEPCDFYSTAFGACGLLYVWREGFGGLPHGGVVWLRYVVKHIDFAFWHYERMPRPHWLYGEEGDGVFVFVHDIAGDVSVDDAGKYAGHWEGYITARILVYIFEKRRVLCPDF